MTEFAPYTVNILLAYGTTLLVIGWLVGSTWRAATRIQRQNRPHDDVPV